MAYKLISYRETYIFIFFLSVYFLTAQGTIQTTDGTIMYSLTKSIVNERSIVLDQRCNNELTKKEVVFCHSKYGILISIIAIPFFLMGKLLSQLTGINEIFTTKLAVSMLNSFVTAISCLLIYKYARKIDFTEKESFTLSLIYGFTTIAWEHSEVFLTEPLSTLFILLTMYFLYPNNKLLTETNFILPGFFFACSVLTKLSNIINIIPVIVYIILLYRKELSKNYIKFGLKTMNFLIPTIIAVFIIGFYNYIKFASPIITGYENESFSTPFSVGLYGILFSPGKSIFLFNPVLIFAIPGFIYFYNSNRNLSLAVLIIFIVNILLFSKWASWMGGWSWGPRYLLLTVPYLTISVGYYLKNARSSKIKIVFILIVLLSFLIQLSSVSINYSRFYYEMGKKFPNDFMDRVMFYPEYSPIKGQFENVKKVISNLTDKKFVNKLVENAKKGVNFKNQDYSTILKEGLAINVPNFWWVYAWLYGIPRWLILSSLTFLIAAVLISGKAIFFNYELHELR